MREIKFRAKIVGQHFKGWVYGTYAKQGGNFVIFDEKTFDRHIIDPTTLGQFTGLLDKNGKEIYEGDIVEVAWGKGETFHKGKVVFYNAQFQVEVEGAKTTLSHFGQDWVEVIGNIYENKELLK